MQGPKQLLKWRKKENKSQRQCAEALGVSQAAWCGWERGGEPGVTLAIAIAELTNNEVPVTAWVKKRGGK